MEFRWIDWNIDKLGTHEVQPEEAEFVVEQAAHPYPQLIDRNGHGGSNPPYQAG